VIHSEWEQIHWPDYWHYDFFHGLRAVAMLGLLSDPRADDAMDLLRLRRKPDGTWRAGGRHYWTRHAEVVDWGDAHHLVTPVALAMLQ
jgi:hypothetical protein